MSDVFRTYRQLFCAKCQKFPETDHNQIFAHHFKLMKPFSSHNSYYVWRSDVYEGWIIVTGLSTFLRRKTQSPNRRLDYQEISHRYTVPTARQQTRMNRNVNACYTSTNSRLSGGLSDPVMDRACFLPSTLLQLLCFPLQDQLGAAIATPNMQIFLTFPSAATPWRSTWHTQTHNLAFN